MRSFFQKNIKKFKNSTFSYKTTFIATVAPPLQPNKYGLLIFIFLYIYTHTQPQVAKIATQNWLQNVLTCFIIVLKKKGVTIMSISEKIYALRTKNGVTQEVFAEKLAI